MSRPTNSDITQWRERIDELDLELLRILNERAACAIEIGKIKRRQKMAIYDPKREENVVRMMIENNGGPLDEEGVRSLFERIIDESRRIERVTAVKDDEWKMTSERGEK